MDMETVNQYSFQYPRCLPGFLTDNRLSLVLLHLRVPGWPGGAAGGPVQGPHHGVHHLPGAVHRLPCLLSQHTMVSPTIITFHDSYFSVNRYEPQSYWWTDTLLALYVAHRFGKITNHIT